MNSRHCRYFLLFAYGLSIFAQNVYSLAPAYCVLGKKFTSSDKGQWLALFYEDRSVKQLCPLHPLIDKVFVNIKRCEIDGNESQSLSCAMPTKTPAMWFIRGLSMTADVPRIPTTATWKEYCSDPTGNGETTTEWKGTFNNNPIIVRHTAQKTGSDYQINLIWNGHTQNLVSEKGTNEGMVGLEYIGDIDNDGRPDLILLASRHYVCYTWRLFLSSEAKPGKMVRQVTNFISMGE